MPLTRLLDAGNESCTIVSTVSNGIRLKTTRIPFAIGGRDIIGVVDSDRVRDETLT
jgi:hypothetical protein